jgi:hypothetical protein
MIGPTEFQMGKRIRGSSIGTAFILTLALLCVVPGRLLAQFLPEEIAQREAFEKILLNAEILRFEEIGEGITKPYKLFLKHGEGEVKAAWKNPSGKMYGFLEGWQYEIAAYRLDKLLGTNMVPVAVEREFQGKPGALVLWVENAKSLLALVEEEAPVPKSAVEQTNNMKYLIRAWDCLLANDDRTQQNILYTEDWRTIAFDHSRAFRCTRQHRRKLMYGAHGLKTFANGQPVLFRRLPRWFVENVKALTFDSIKAAVGPYLTDDEIEAVLARRDLLLVEVAEMIKNQGEAAVLYENF